MSGGCFFNLAKQQTPLVAENSVMLGTVLFAVPTVCRIAIF